MKKIFGLWPELLWINDENLRTKTAETWRLALSKSVLTIEDLQKIPFTLLCGPDLQVSFMAHKRCVVQVAYESAKKMQMFFKDELPVNMDYVVAGAILADVGKLLEYEMKDGKSCVGNYGKYLRHPFSGVPWPSNAVYPLKYAISLPLTPVKAIWCEAPDRSLYCTSCRFYDFSAF
jgi:hypothetical protein